MSVEVHVRPVGLLRCNCVVIGDRETSTAVVIDPGGEGEAVLRWIAGLHLRCAAILNTHAHIDHIGANHAVKTATGAAIHLHELDLSLYSRMTEQAAAMGDLLPVSPCAPVDVAMQDGDRLRFGGIAIDVLHTPGHSPGSVCFLVEESSPQCLFSGDTLFAGGVGRTDLLGGDFETEIVSIRSRLLTLDDRTRVVPGHGPETTIGEERRFNPFLRGETCL
ncbi:MAG: MBL fold metallo-hydrolase [Vicinamibacteria bacterium]|nr:MBL fold metallo-hydrolase [Vicinamibacteria bacterium]